MILDRNDIPTIADEYALGLLEPGEMAEVEHAMEEDEELRAAIIASRERFLPLDTSMEAVGVDDALWQRIEHALPPQAVVNQTRSAPPANDNGRNQWRTAALAAIAATVMLAAGLAYNLTRTIEPLVVAVLVNDRGEVQAVVEDFGNERTKVRMLADFSVPNDKTIQVWTLPSREMGPVSLGLIDNARSVSLDGPALPTPRDDQLYEITLEQAGGSPTGRPTGPILAKGLAKLQR